MIARALIFLLAAGTAAGAVSFNDDVRPILSDNCFFCHGPDKDSLEADLRLDLRESAVAAGALAPGDPDSSALLFRVSHHDEGEVMPPPKSKIGRLSGDQVAILRQWIAEGAAYEDHWAFVPVPDEVPVPDPAQHRDWIRNPIDAFVFSGLAAAGLAPQPEADRRTLARRVTFDLTGLPPTPAEVETFVADRSPQAYANLVDRLLASPRYGERMAADWLDLARYADSYGYQVDRDRDVWPWRDWVIGAFNSNLPYDTFLTWQLAGDLLEKPTDEQVLATTFNRLHQQKVEGGSVEEEFRVEYVADRVHTFGTAFLGLTLECARCHDHKFDPVSQTNYFELFAFFQNIDEAGLYSYFTPSVPTPAAPIMDGIEKNRLAELEASVAEAETKAGALEPSGGGGETARFVFDPADPGRNETDPGQPLKIHGDNEIVAGPEIGSGAVKLTGDDPVELPVGNFARWEPFSVALKMRTPDAKERAVVFHRSKAWTDAASRGYEFLIEDSRLKWSLIHFWPGNAISIRTLDPVPVGEWVHVAVTYDGSSRAGGLSIYVDGQRAATEVVRDGLTKQITGGGGDTITIGERMRDHGFARGQVADFRVFGRQLMAGEIPALVGGAPLAGQPDPAYTAALADLQSARESRDRFRDGIREIMVMRELPEPKPAYRLERGAYDAPAEQVGMAVPEFLGGLPGGAQRNRLGLAQWLVGRTHPLTARTAANRFWQAAFGRGLVETSEDFGSQGAVPTYPQLLDWLSAEFMDGGWDIKGLMRTIVSSHTYRQRSLGPPALMADDPKNALLARGPSRRLPAEMIRDNALAVSGLLVEKIGGQPARPYEIAESFRPGEPDSGDGLYRRSLYTYWRTTGPAPAMLSFDAVKRDVCAARRDATATPLQSLILLNGTQFVEASRVLGESLVREAGGDLDSVVGRAFTLLTSRPPDAREREILGQLYTDELAAFQADPARAAAFLTNGAAPPDATLPPAEVAAAGLLVNALLNSDACTVSR
ncbi:DUF1553 domain-containing protein [soil metagenome]